MIKSVIVKPIALFAEESGTYTMVKIELDAAELASFYLKNGIDPATIKVPYIIETKDGPNRVHMSLTDAVATGHEVSAFNYLDFGTVRGG